MSGWDFAGYQRPVASQLFAADEKRVEALLVLRGRNAVPIKGLALPDEPRDVVIDWCERLDEMYRVRTNGR